MEEGKHFIDSGSVRKSPLTKQKILDVYADADVFEGLRTFPGEPYKFKLKKNMCLQGMPPEMFLSIYKMTFIKKYMFLSNEEC